MNWIGIITFIIGLQYTSPLNQTHQSFDHFTPKEMEMGSSSIEIIIRVGSSSFSAQLWENPTAKSFLDQMPFSVEVEDYAGIEKIFYPYPKLSVANAPKGADPNIGDIMYYAPWGDVAIFYKDFGFANGLIPIGKMEDVVGFVKALAGNPIVHFEII